MVEIYTINLLVSVRNIFNAYIDPHRPTEDANYPCYLCRRAVVHPSPLSECQAQNAQTLKALRYLCVFLWSKPHPMTRQSEMATHNHSFASRLLLRALIPLSLDWISATSFSPVLPHSWNLLRWPRLLYSSICPPATLDP